MSNIMLPNIVSSARPNNRPDPKAQVDPGNEDNFSRYLDKKIRTERQERSNLVGVKKHQRSSKDNNPAIPEKKDNEEGENVSAAAFLQQLLADLQDLVKKPGAEAGKWVFQLKNTDMLDRLAEQAGMNPADLASLKEQMKTDGTIDLAGIFAQLEEHLKSIQNPQAIAAPETDLPTLESMLSRMGVDANKLAEMSNKSIDDQGKFDLSAYLQCLKSLPNDGSLKSIKVSGPELQQVRDMLASAGVSNRQLGEIFPEKIVAWQRDIAGLPPIVNNTPKIMSFAHLKEILAQGISYVEGSKPKVNLPGFLQNLSDVLSQSGFVKGGAGFTPVVQESLTSAYQELQKMVNLAKVKVDRVNDIVSINQELAEQWQGSGGKTEKLLETSPAGGAGKTEIIEPVTSFGKNDSTPVVVDDKAHEHTSTDGETRSLAGASDSGHSGRQVQEFRMPVMIRPSAAQILQQFAMDQLSQGVTQALQQDEHHLTLTMYPKELGEVKVDLQIRNNHLAVSFVMDNHKVKEALEKNMEEFKDNLNRQGYNLEACAVLIDQQHKDSDGTRQQFEAAWEQLSVNSSNNRQADGGGLAESIKQISSLRSNRWPESSISVFV